MGAIGYVLLLLLNGFLVGALARLLVPGPDPMSIFQTTVVGVAGSLIAGLITYYVFDEARGWGFVIALLWAVAICLRSASSASASSGRRRGTVRRAAGCSVGARRPVRGRPSASCPVASSARYSRR